MNRKIGLSPARVMGQLVCHEYGTGLFPVAGRMVMVNDDGAAGQFGWSELAGLGNYRTKSTIAAAVSAGHPSQGACPVGSS
jgi:hypothetical protein